MIGAIFKYNSIEKCGLILGENGYIYQFKNDFFIDEIYNTIAPMTSVEFQDDFDNRIALNGKIIKEQDINKYIIPDEHLILRNKQCLWNYYHIEDVQLSENKSYSDDALYERLLKEESEAKLKSKDINATINYQIHYISNRYNDFFRSKGQPAIIGLKSVFGKEYNKEFDVVTNHHDHRINFDKKILYITSILLVLLSIAYVDNLINFAFAMIFNLIVLFVIFKSRSMDVHSLLNRDTKKESSQSFEIALSDIIPYTDINQKDIYLKGGLFLYNKNNSIEVIYNSNYNNINYDMAICIKDESKVQEYLNLIYQHTSISQFYKCQKFNCLYYPVINDEKEYDSMCKLVNNYSDSIANEYMNDLDENLNVYNKTSIFSFFITIFIVLFYFDVNYTTLTILGLLAIILFFKRDNKKEINYKVLKFKIEKTRLFNIIKI